MVMVKSPAIKLIITIAMAGIIYRSPTNINMFVVAVLSFFILFFTCKNFNFDNLYHVIICQ